MVRLVLVALAFLLGLIAQSLFERRLSLADGVILYLLAGGIAVAALGHSVWPEEARPATRRDGGAVNPLDRRRGRLALMAALLAASIASVRLWVQWQPINVRDGFPLYGVALILSVYGFSRIEGWRVRAKLSAAIGAVRDNQHEALALTAIIVFAAWMRLGALDYYPPPGGLGSEDEAQFGGLAARILSGLAPWQYMTSLYPIALTFRWLGQTTLALRLPFAIMGVLMVLLFYPLARPIVGRGPALAAVFLFAASRWHTAAMRIAYPVNTEALIELAAIILLWHGWRGGSRLSFVLSGALTSLGIYGYAGSRIVPIIVMCYAGLRILSDLWRGLHSAAGRRRATLRAYLAPTLYELALYALGAVIAIVPFLHILALEPHSSFTERFTSIIPAVSQQDKLAALRDALPRARYAVLVFNYEGDGWGMFNIPGKPMLDPITGVLFVLSMAACLAFFWKENAQRPLIWFWLTLVGGMILPFNTPTYRLIGLIPAIYLAIALFLSALWRQLEHHLTGGHRQAAVILGCTVLGVAAGLNADTFFNQQIHHPAVRGSFMSPRALAGVYIAEQTDNPYVYVAGISAFYTPETDYGWLAGSATGRFVWQLGDALPDRDSRGSDVLYIFLPPYSEQWTASLVTGVYTNAACERREGVENRYLFTACRVAARDIQAMRGLEGRYFVGTNRGTQPAVVRQDAALDFDWRRDAPVNGPFSADWTGAIYVPQYESVTLVAESTAPLAIVIDGKPILTTPATAQQTIKLAQGWHVFSAHLTGATPAGVTRLYEIREGQRVLVPRQRFANSTFARGILGRFYSRQDWQGQPFLEQVQPYPIFMCDGSCPAQRLPGQERQNPFSAEWTANLSIPQTGTYGFTLRVLGGRGELQIDGRRVVATLEGRFNEVVTAAAATSLTAGEHLLRFRYVFSGGEFPTAWLTWTPPGGEEDVIPPRLLKPASLVGP